MADPSIEPKSPLRPREERNTAPSATHRARGEGWGLAIAFGIVALCMAAATASHLAGFVSLPDLVRDMAGTADVSPLAGAVSVIGVWLMIGAAAVGMFAWYMGPRSSASRDLRRLLLGLGAISLLLAADDQFLFHERLARLYLGLGESKVVGLEALVIIAVLVICRSALRAGGLLTLAVAIGCGSLSIGVDKVLASYSGAWRIGLEDGLKLAAMACWMVFVVRAAAAHLRPSGPHVTAG